MPTLISKKRTSQLLRLKYRIIKDLIHELHHYKQCQGKVRFSNFISGDGSVLGLHQKTANLTEDSKSTRRPQCRDISGTFVTLAGAKFEISSHKTHKTIKKVGRKYEVAFVNSSFMSVLFSLPVTIHMAFVEEMLIKQM